MMVIRIAALSKVHVPIPWTRGPLFRKRDIGARQAEGDTPPQGDPVLVTGVGAELAGSARWALSHGACALILSCLRNPLHGISPGNH
jgi:hypothetical protein